MSSTSSAFVLGEFRRTIDERFRLSIPGELTDPLMSGTQDCILAKEQPGALSLWNAELWQAKIDEGVQLVRSKMRAGRLEGRIEEVQRLGRLLSTRHKKVNLAERGRLLLPEGFREFLGVEPGGDVLIVGAAVCLEIWRPEAWFDYLKERMPEFRNLFDNLSA